MSVSIARFAQIAPMAWKNGLGSTTKLAIHPPDATTDAFEWRISIAEVAHSARFSKFEGIDRTLVVLEGTMTLLRAGADPMLLTPELPPVCFPGDVEVEARVDAGPVRDLNVMTLRTKWRAKLGRTSLRGGGALSLHGRRLACALNPQTRLQMAGAEWDAHRFDLVRASEPCELRVVSANGLDAYVIEFEECAS